MSIFHPGELAVQRRAGQEGIAEKVGRTVHATVPEAAARFLAEQPMVVIAGPDRAGRPWVTRLTGPPGFVRVLDNRTIELGSIPGEGDPLASRPESWRIGLIAIQPDRRRRMRANGTARHVGDRLRITVDQVYSNCPKYISRRHIVATVGGTHSDSGIRRGTELDPRQRAAVGAADAFFVGSADEAGRADASHRGGNPGFLEVRSPTRLYWPEYRGNSMFMTLGNLAREPRCGLLIPDWATGGMLQLTGTTGIVWPDRPGVAAPAGVEFTVHAVVEHPAGPLRWSPPELSPVNP
ncbi:pyridoxamine 5'-phosphate oxidase family protein [Nocardia sp. NPDC051750]|uniref:pyridoxamine 5'-phosphate oxidase family protein n=1 Tax=Nocardia sp. NPDC051750 TaxID=3364325 RepID=UPI00379EE135